MRCVCLVRRCAVIASSFPTVVGVAGCPCVLASMGMFLVFCASVLIVFISFWAAGSQMFVVACFIPNA